MLLPIGSAEAAEAARFLDRSTWILRWLVAFFRRFSELPREAGPGWSFWMQMGEGAAAGRELRAIVAHGFHTGVSYAAASPGADLRELEDLLAEEVLPERLVLDRPVLDDWERRAGDPLRRAREREEMVVLAHLESASDTEPEVPTGFRAARKEDAPRLREMEALFAREMREDEPQSDVSLLVEKGLIFVVEEEGEAAAMVRSNLSDGRFVHLGGLFVLPARRGKGIAARLLSGAAAAVRRDGSSAVIDTRRGNLPTLAACRSAGFREVGEGVVLRFGEDAWRGRG